MTPKMEMRLELAKTGDVGRRGQIIGQKRRVQGEQGVGRCGAVAF